MEPLEPEAHHLCDTDTPSSLSPDKLSLSSQPDDGWTRLLVLAAVSTTLGSAVPFGYTLGVINTPAPLIRQWCNESLVSYELSPAKLDILWSAIVSMFIVGGMISSFAGSWCAGYVGRKGGLAIADVLAFLSAIMFFACKPLSSVTMLFFGRFLAGFSSGLTLSVMPMYLMELAPDSLRGAVAVLTGVGVTLGVLLGQFMGLDWILGTASTWHYLLSMYVVLVAVSALTFPVLPESPKFLYSIRGSKQRALKELSRLRGRPVAEVAAELEGNMQGAGRTRPWSMASLLATPDMRLPVTLVCALQAGQQLSGVNAVCYYSATIFKSAGLSLEASQYATLGVGVINFGVAVIMIPVANCCRRRILLHVSFALITLSLVLLTISITYMDTFSWMPKVTVLCVLMYILVYNLGLGPIPFFIASELFDVGPRSPAMALGSAANWTGNLVVAMTFPTLHSLIGQYSFLVFTAFVVALHVFIHLRLPETFNWNQKRRMGKSGQGPVEYRLPPEC